MSMARSDGPIKGGLNESFPLWGVNFFLLTAVLALGFLVDGNGRIAGLGETPSTALFLVTNAGALAAAGVSIAKGRGWHRWLGAALVIVYLVGLAPLVLP